MRVGPVFNTIQPNFKATIRNNAIKQETIFKSKEPVTIVSNLEKDLKNNTPDDELYFEAVERKFKSPGCVGHMQGAVPYDIYIVNSRNGNKYPVQQCEIQKGETPYLDNDRYKSLLVHLSDQKMGAGQRLKDMLFTDQGKNYDWKHKYDPLFRWDYDKYDDKKEMPH